MHKVTLGNTGITVNKNGFGGLPIQRIPNEEAVKLLHKALDNGIEFYDTGLTYTDSTKKIGLAFADRREKVYLASKAPAKTVEDFWKDLDTMLTNLQTDYLDVYQFHNPAFCPKPGDGTGLYEAALEAKAQGKIRHIGISNHRIAVAKEAVESGLYEVLQYPFSYLSDEQEFELVRRCEEKGIAFIAMKGLAGGVLNNAKAAYTFMLQFDNVLPIWGIQHEWELDQFLACQDQELVMDEEMKALIEKEREELQGDFCRGCGYCLPCPVGIEINHCARRVLMVRRTKDGTHTSPEVQAKMKKIEECINCGQCKAKCPYGLDTPNLLKKQYEEYKVVIANLNK